MRNWSNSAGLLLLVRLYWVITDQTVQFIQTVPVYYLNVHAGYPGQHGGDLPGERDTVHLQTTILFHLGY